LGKNGDDDDGDNDRELEGIIIDSVDRRGQHWGTALKYSEVKIL
jgi:hypothetical protein